MERGAHGLCDFVIELVQFCFLLQKRVARKGTPPVKFAIHQPAFMPWPGFFYKAWYVDSLVLLDTVQFPRGFTWVNRNRLKCPLGELWMTVPVLRKGRGLQRIDEVEVLPDPRWRRKDLLSFEHNYRHAPFFSETIEFLSELYTEAPHRLIYWNLQMIDWLLPAFGLGKDYLLLSELGIAAKGSELISRIGRDLGATIFVAPRAARCHIDVQILEGAGLTIEWLHYTPPVYPQLWGDFVKDLSALDLVFNYGVISREILERAQQPAPRGA